MYKSKLVNVLSVARYLRTIKLSCANIHIKSFLVLSQVKSTKNQSKHQHKTNHTYTNIKQIFDEFLPSVFPLLQKDLRLGRAGIIDHPV